MTGTEWGEWDALPGENPDDCLRSQNADKITQISNVITDGAVTDGAITDGAITDGAITDGAITDGAITEGDIAYGDITSGAVTPNGPAKVFVNGKALPNTPSSDPPQPSSPRPTRAGGCWHFRPMRDRAGSRRP